MPDTNEPGSPIVLADNADRGPEEQATGELMFVGTATVLLRIGGFTILTDPNFLHAGDHAYLGLGLRSKRLTEPALQPADLPPLDAVVLSHHHGDHFDHIAARELDPGVPILTEPGSARKLRKQGFRRPIGLRTWQSQTLERGDALLRVTAVPAKHAPRPLGFVLPSVMGSVLDLEIGGEHRFRIYVTGDTLLHHRLREIPDRFPDIDLCLIHLGGTRVAGILLTMDGAQGARLLEIIEPRTALPIHYDDYTVFKSPLDHFRAEVGRSDRLTAVTDVRYVDRGETYRFALTGTGGPRL